MLSRGTKMAETSILEDQFNCSVCLGQLNDPVTIPCGHSYCMSCIKDYWDQADQIGLYRCPLCMQSFTTRPVLSKNIIMGEMIEKLKRIQIQAAVPAHSRAGPGDYVECDICTGTKRRAVKSCLVCLESFCQTHFEHHEEFHTGEPNKSHDAVTDVAENTEKQHYVKTTQLKSAVSRAEGLLGWDTNEPRRTDAKLKKLLRARDYIRLLQSLQSDSGSLLKETLEDIHKERIQNIKSRASESLSRTVPKSRPRPFSVALQPSTYTVLEPWAGSFKTSTAPVSLSRTVSKSRPRPFSVALQPSTSTVLEPWARSFKTSIAPEISISKASESQLRTSTSPKSQFRTSTTSQISISTTSGSQLRTSASPKSQFRTSTAPEPQFKNVVEELMSRLSEKK